MAHYTPYNDSAVSKALFIKKSPRPFGLMFATLCYLLVEFAFNSRLLDALGGVVSEDAIQSIEMWGRLLSGCAVVLMCYPFFSKYGFIFKLICCSLIMFVVYFSEKGLIEYLVNHMVPERRYTAANLMPVQHALVSGDVEINGLSATAEQLRAPDGKAFLATFPFMLLTTQDIDKKINEQKPVLIRHVVDGNYGGLAVNFDRYRESVAALTHSYNVDYLNGSREYNNALSPSNIRQKQDEAWMKYRRALYQRNRFLNSESRLSNIPRGRFAEVRYDVRKQGVPVSNTWVPSDKDGFYRAVEVRVRQETVSTYKSKMITQAGVYIPPDKTWDVFIGTYEIQQKWRDKLKYPSNINFAICHNESEFNQVIYNKVIDTVKPLVKRVEKVGKHGYNARVSSLFLFHRAYEFVSSSKP